MGCITRANQGKGPGPAPLQGPDPAGCDPVAALGNSWFQMLMLGTQPAAPAAPTPPVGPKAAAARITPGSAPAPKKLGDHGYVTGSKDGVGAGVQVGAGTSENPSTWWGSASGEDGKASVSVGGARTTGAPGRTGHSAGASWDWSDPLGSFQAHVAKTEATPVPGTAGAPGAMDKTSTAWSVGAGGVGSQRSTTTGGVTDKTGINFGKDGVGVAMERTGAGGRGAAGSFGFSGDRFDVGATYKHNEGTSVGGSFHRVDQLSAGVGANPALSGPGYEVSRTQGTGASLSAEVESGPFGFGASGSASNRDVVSFQRGAAGAQRDHAGGGSIWSGMGAFAQLMSNPMARDAWLKERYASKIDGVSGVADADLLGLEVGDGYSFLHHDASEGEINGRAGALSVGFGDKNLDTQRTSIGRTEQGWSIRVENSTSDADIAKASLFKMFGASETTTEASGGSVQLTIADGPEGRAQLQKFASTGLLPGAERLADPEDPDRQAVERLGPLIGTLRANGAPDVLVESMRAELFAASGRLNARVLGAGGERILDAAPGGVTYEEQTRSRSGQDEFALSLLGKDLLSSGTTQNWWETDYREGGKKQTEHGYARDEDHFFAPNEATGVAVNPKDPRLAKQGVELVLHSLQETSVGQRKVMDRVGAGGMDPAMRSAWVKGQVHDGERTRMAMVLTGDQLDTIRDRLGPEKDDFKQLRADAHNALDDFANPMLQTKTSRELVGMGGKGPMAMLAGRERAEDLIAKVGSSKDFDALDFDEKRKFLIFASQGAQYRDEWKSKGTDRKTANPWRALPLALREQDPKARGELVRTMFESIEGSSLDSTTALVQLVDFLDQDGKAAGLSAEERKSLVAGLAVGVEDGRVDGRAKALAKAPTNAGKMVADGLLSDSKRDLAMNDRRFTMDFNKIDAAIEGNRGDAMVDWLMAADQAGGTALTDGVQGAIARDPKLVERILKNTRHEPWRQETAMNLLRRAGVKV